MRNNPRRIAAASFFAACALSFAGEKTVVLGGRNGWNDVRRRDGVSVGKGRFGYDALELEIASLKKDSGTALFVSFDGEKISEETGNYTIIESNLTPVRGSAREKSAAFSNGTKKGLVLERKFDSSSAGYSVLGSFAIDFWLCPSLCENGETVYFWQSSLNYDNYLDYQQLSATFENNRLEWKLKNFFPAYFDDEIVLKGYTTIIPGEWKHHTICFDGETGCLEYFVDGKTEDIKFITSTGHEDGSVCVPLLGIKSSVEICPQFTGKIDEVRIQRGGIKIGDDILSSGNEAYKASGGMFVSEPILTNYGSVLNSIDALTNIPPQTEIRFFVRGGDNCYEWTDVYPAWEEVSPGENITDVHGLYFQVAAKLLPDGGCSVSPSVTQLDLQYTEAELPLPPFIVNAESGDGKVTLSWNYSVDDSAGGYYVYYGNRPGEYLGSIAVEGASPVKVGNTTSITLTGLENGRIYYFAVSAYSRFDSKITGEFSKEVYARPSRRLAKK